MFKKVPRLAPRQGNHTGVERLSKGHLSPLPSVDRALAFAEVQLIVMRT